MHGGACRAGRDRAERGPARRCRAQAGRACSPKHSSAPRNLRSETRRFTRYPPFGDFSHWSAIASAIGPVLIGVAGQRCWRGSRRPWCLSGSVTHDRTAHPGARQKENGQEYRLDGGRLPGRRHHIRREDHRTDTRVAGHFLDVGNVADRAMQSSCLLEVLLRAAGLACRRDSCAGLVLPNSTVPSYRMSRCPSARWK
jgi:hypothetical protein